MQYKRLLKNFSHKFIRLLGSKKFFYGVIALFVLQALWFVFSAQYPMAFDENFHYGLIQVYSEQWSPFITAVPEGTGPLGALTREPSYLFPYLMSFPYRFFALFTESQDVLIILLRLINVVLFTGGLFAFRKLLLSVKASTALTHFSILIFSLIPITPFLAAHINYDNLLFLLVPLALILTLHCARDLRANSFPVRNLSLLIILCLITTIVKYPFLPVLVGIATYLAGVLVWKKSKRDLYKIFLSIRTNFNSLTGSAKILLVSGLVISGGLFFERHGMNYIQYNSFVPDCVEVVDFDHCSQYGPWIRNYEIRQNAPEHVEPNLPYYAANWFYDMSYRLFFAINSEYYTQPPLAAPFITSFFIAISGTILTILFLPRLIRKYKGLLLFMSVLIIYAGTLFIRGYSSYLNTTEFLALNGRYFIPVMLLIFVIIGLAYRELFLYTQGRAVIWKTGFAIAVIALFLQGGGVMTYIIRSDMSWHRQEPLVLQTNQTVKEILDPIIIGKDVEVPLSN